MAALTLEALPKNVVVADSLGKVRPSSFLLRSASEPHLSYMFSKYDHMHLAGADSIEFSPSSSRSPSPNGKDESIFSNPEDDNSSTSTTGSTTPKRPAPVLERRHTLHRSPELSSSSSSSFRSLKSKKRQNGVAFMKAPASEGHVVTLSSSHRSSSSISLSSVGNTIPRKDELWLGFKTLESDYSKFNCKSILQRTHILRCTLIPFLRKFDGITSSVPIDINELDRRIRTLNKWWILLLASLRANGANMVPLQDRSTYLEGVTGVMSRPEWRAAPSSLAPLSTRNPSPSNSCSSLSSASSTISYEKSLQHDMKVMYTTSLLDTLAFTLDGLSEQQCGALVHFAGKVIAYAFFFVNGVSEMLIGLLGLKAPQLRKVLNEYGIGRGMDLQAVAEGVIGEFPHALHSVGFTTMSAALPRLKKPGNYMVATSNIDWKGPWIPRWTGRETDLFFVFVKHYHLLLAEYLPFGITATARLCAPGFLFIQAQLLSLLETAIHRGPPHLLPQENAPSNVTFDDIVGAHVVNGNAMQPAPSKTMYRPLMDQRIFSLLKDITMDKNFNDAMRDVFATAFANLLKSLAKNTKIVEHSACVSLCDLLEEGIPALYQFEKQSENGAKYIDWPFWMDVSKQMIKNENSMTELRLFSFIFVVWDLIAEDPERKRSICLDWLLADDMWQRFFSHWCPMVRAFYMRLVCWRVGRLGGHGSDREISYTADGVEISTASCDQEIFDKLMTRLHEAHGAFVYMRDESDRTSSVRPSVAPCPPAPNRKLSILRVETQPGFGRPFSLDKMVQPQAEAAKPAPDPKATQLESNGTIQENGGSTIKRKWSLLRNFLGAAEALKPDPTPTPVVQPKASLAPQQSSRGSAGSAYIPPRASSGREAWHGTKVPYGAAFMNRTRMQFKFVLEFSDRPPHARKGKGSMVPRLPRLTQDWLESIGEGKESSPPAEPTTLSPSGPVPRNWKYYGRALAEWTLVVDEIDNFVERRKNEGIRDFRDTEIPILSVDSLRKG
ncbi:hypothetical protein H072_1667 [Dactylellina haptotyla CBS 200.50]|uniref:Uncharacterized protein n=1 Tax=Dactylellina haptotyla (strain CBS 200.50) TaxID=1284197 RepID=S8ATR8_DACHA|nr:hypothetical protein H072_1667 [Dactylellina haptotyla CBS 200.50]